MKSAMVFPRKHLGISELNGASDALKGLFGVPDSDDADYPSNSTKMLLKNNHDTQMLMTQQINVISDAIIN